MAKKIKYSLLSVLVVLLVVLAYMVLIRDSSKDIKQPSQETSQTSMASVDGIDESDEVEIVTYDFDSADSIQVLVNKQESLPLDYTPDLIVPNVTLNTNKSESELSVDKRIASSVERLFKAADKAGLDIMLASAYRSVELQRFYYNNYVQTFSQEEADKFSAKPGHSEHQTGLAIDIANVSDNICYLNQCFAVSEAGMWLADNAHKYGFILRYPKESSKITGYDFEPWHFRYVGEELAKEIYLQDLTYEEFVQNSVEE